MKKNAATKRRPIGERSGSRSGRTSLRTCAGSVRVSHSHTTASPTVTLEETSSRARHPPGPWASGALRRKERRGGRARAREAAAPLRRAGAAARARRETARREGPPASLDGGVEAPLPRFHQAEEMPSRKALEVLARTVCVERRLVGVLLVEHEAAWILPTLDRDVVDATRLLPRGLGQLLHHLGRLALLAFLCAHV